MTENIFRDTTLLSIPDTGSPPTLPCLFPCHRAAELPTACLAPLPSQELQGPMAVTRPKASLENLFPSHPRIRSHRTFVCRSRETGKQVLPWCGEGGTGKLSKCPKKASLSQPPSPAALLGTCVQESSAGSSAPPGHRAMAKHPGPLSPGMLSADRALADGVAHGGTKDYPEQFGQGLPRHDTLPVVVLLFRCSLRAW